MIWMTSNFISCNDCSPEHKQSITDLQDYSDSATARLGEVSKDKQKFTCMEKAYLNFVENQVRSFHSGVR